MKSKIEKTTLHPNNPHRFGYDFKSLSAASPEIQKFIIKNEEHQTIDFSDPNAVKALNKALLIQFHNIRTWDIPKDYLCPAIPGRADYIHSMADLLAESNNGTIPQGRSVVILDIGTGASCIYPIIGNAAYDWSFVATDVDPKAIENAATIVESNPHLIEAVSLQQQLNNRFIFKDIIQSEDMFAFTMCNPPFHNSREEATKGTLRKLSNLEGKKAENAILNFGGKQNELWCEGGELAFITQTAYESAKFPMQCLWFSTLVSKAGNVNTIHKILEKVNASEIKTIELAQGQKTSRVIAWTFHSKLQQADWKF